MDVWNDKFEDCEFANLKLQDDGSDVKTIACYEEKKCVIKPPDSEVAALKADAGFNDLDKCAEVGCFTLYEHKAYQWMPFTPPDICTVLPAPLDTCGGLVTIVEKIWKL